MRRRLPRLLAALGSVLLAVGLFAGIVNREVIDGTRFVDHVDAIRQDPDVSRQVGQAMTERVLSADPDLVAFRPVIESSTQTLASGPAFGLVVRSSARQFHRAFTESGPVVIRLADVGAVLVTVLSTYAPDAASKLPPDLGVTLSEVGSQSFASDTIHLARLATLLSWLLPLLAAIGFAAAVAVSRDRRRGLADVGWGVFGAGAMLATVGFGVWLLTSFADTDTLSGALVVAARNELRAPVWVTAAAAMVAGAVFAVATVRSRRRDVPERLAAGWAWLVQRTGSPRQRLVRSGVWIVVGLGLVFRPSVMLTAGAVALGVAAGVHGCSLAIVLSREWAAEPHGGRRRLRLDPRWGPAAAGTLSVALLAALLVVLVRPVDDEIAAATPSGAGPCNGHVELCARRYDQVAFPSTHNSMSAADEPNWFLAEQPTGLVGQLDDGIRVLLIDTWYGQTTQRPDVVATASRSREQATAEAVDTYGQSVVDSALRLRDAASLRPTGAVEPYLCHGLCEMGSTPLEPAMEEVRDWLQVHPREVVTLFIQDEVTPEDTAQVFDDAGLLPYVHVQPDGEPWPTLGQMIDSGQRLVVLMENHGGGTAYPWLLQGFDWVQDTPYDYASAADFSCKRLRGNAASPLFLINHWLNEYQSQVSNARKVNAYDVLWPRVQKCQRQRGLLPNYVSVNFYDQGDLLAVVDRLNGFD